MPSILNEIAAYKRGWIHQCKERVSEKKLLEQAFEYTPCDFVGALTSRISRRQNAVIAEIKKASPSKGVICEYFDPVRIAQCYDEANAACLSILTDVKYFQGSDDYVRAIRAHVDLPILRKDFMLEPYQVIESRAMGADCILIIMAMIDDDLAQELCITAQEQGLSVLVEVHNADELQRGLKLSTPLIGINNRDLHTFEINLQTTVGLLKIIPKDRTVITESGIFTSQDIERMNQSSVYGFLIGESLMRQSNPGKALQALIQS